MPESRTAARLTFILIFAWTSVLSACRPLSPPPSDGDNPRDDYSKTAESVLAATSQLKAQTAQAADEVSQAVADAESAAASMPAATGTVSSSSRLAAWAEEIRMVPAYRDGTMYGGRFFDVEPEGFWGRAGLRDDDVLVEARTESSAITEPQAVMMFFLKLAERPSGYSAVLVLERGGKRVSLPVRL